jgi:hypothetical protein
MCSSFPFSSMSVVHRNFTLPYKRNTSLRILQFIKNEKYHTLSLKINTSLKCITIFESYDLCFYYNINT